MMNGYCKLKDASDFTKAYHSRNFPHLPSCQKFNKRLNNLSGVIILLAQGLTQHLEVTELNSLDLLDSCPVVLANSKRQHEPKLRLTCAVRVTARMVCSTTR